MIMCNCFCKLEALRWLPVQARTDYKLLTVCCHNFFSESDSSLAYFSDLSLCTPFPLPGSFILLQTHEYYVVTKTFSQRYFSYCAPKQWKSLPSDIRHTQSSHTFKTALKTLTYLPPAFLTTFILHARAHVRACMLLARNRERERDYRIIIFEVLMYTLLLIF